jgi:hypothetical protein
MAKLIYSAITSLDGYLAAPMLGRGKEPLPNDVRLKLELLDERPFGNGVVHLHYRTRT